MGRSMQDEVQVSNGGAGNPPGSQTLADAVQNAQHLELVARELRHRTDNIFAVVSAIIRLSSRNAKDPQELADKLFYRVNALATAHRVSIDAETRSEAESDLRTLASEIVEPYNDEVEQRFVLKGAPVHLARKAITPIGLVLHELATNALKYGALSTDNGKVIIDWSQDADSLTINWQENGGPAITPGEDADPVSGGSGSRIMRGVLAGLGGSISFDYAPEGLVAQVRIPKTPN